jgi:hypothetical protein
MKKAPPVKARAENTVQTTKQWLTLYSNCCTTTKLTLPRIIATVRFLVFGSVISTVVGPVSAPTVKEFVLNGLCLQNWAAYPMFTFNPSWSLAVEVFFYALTPGRNSTHAGATDNPSWI